MITANVVLKGEEEKDSFSVFYGQTYGSEGESFNSKEGDKFMLSGPHSVYNVTEFVNDVPLNLTQEEVFEAFNERRNYVGTDSGTVLHEIVNLVYVFRKLLSKRLIQDGKEKKKCYKVGAAARKRIATRHVKWH